VRFLVFVLVAGVFGGGVLCGWGLGGGWL